MLSRDTRKTLLSLLEAPAKTYAAAQSEMLAALQEKGWAVKADLKIPHATSSDGKTRLWFKTQAVYFTFIGGKGAHPSNRHEFGNARTLSYDTDIRKMSVDDLIADAKRRADLQQKDDD